ncbi:hypothetical protein F3Y22_tig00111817pilonHSYRG00072 [Hibiscus syriacus]|uniref:Uncharacterized protein n=1 Tax=Hibiscus syriacus TaxID=106335 RepID=A0A6A2XT55_HIBSY|nr:hypothetical protein F3Y22_tig00111817pilonHSYRG00072 [Hibiscus syriacus]
MQNKNKNVTRKLPEIAIENHNFFSEVPMRIRLSSSHASSSLAPSNQSAASKIFGGNMVVFSASIAEAPSSQRSDTDHGLLVGGNRQLLGFTCGPWWLYNR